MTLTITMIIPKYVKEDQDVIDTLMATGISIMICTQYLVTVRKS